MTRHVAIRESENCRLVQNLLPGIPDDIVLCEIVTKLGWKDFFTLACVGHAIQSGTVYHWRVLSHSLEPVITVYDDGDHTYFTHNTIALYSMRDNSWHKLPRIPNIHRGRHGIPVKSNCISMDGKIYVMGGRVDSDISDKVFVFDVARQGSWHQCASMKQPRLQFKSAVLDGKIYVFGGINYLKESHVASSKPKGMLDAEVYDPKEDTWSTISPMTTSRSDYQVTATGEELFVYSLRTALSTRYIRGIRTEYSMDAYHPFKDEWRVVNASWNLNQSPYAVIFNHVFTFQENIFSLQPREYLPGFPEFTQPHIYKCNIHENSLMAMQSFNWFTCEDVLVSGLAHETSRFLWPAAILAVDDELIAIIRCRREGLLSMFQSRGFNSESQQISWKLRAITLSQVADKARYFIQKL